MANITIVGAGMMGSATSYPLSDNGNSVRLVGTHLDGEIIKSCKERHFHPTLRRDLPAGVTPYFVEEIGQALDGVDIIVSGVCSEGVHWIGQTIGPYLQPGHLVIAVTKGLEAAENGDLVILPDVLASELPADIRHRVKLAAIGGPCIAGELAARRQSCVVFGSRHADAIEQLAATFRTSYYHVSTTTDLVGLEVCAAFKNAYTLAVAIADGLLERDGGPDDANAHMHNLAAAAFGQACTEIDRLLQMMGGTQAFTYGLPGAGDLFVTVQGGRSMRLGKMLGKGLSFAQAREALAGLTLEAAMIVQVMGEALPKLTTRGIVSAEELPLLRALVDVIVDEKPAYLPAQAFFA